MPPSDDQGIPAVANGTRRSRFMAAALAVALGVGGTSMVGYAVTHQQVAPQPSLAAADPQGPQTATTMLPAARPISIRIPAINVSSPVNSVGLNSDHTMETPNPGPFFDQAAWYRYSPTPGQLGPSVIVGHLDSAEGPSVFFKLGALKPGQRIAVTRADHTTATFEVDSVESFPKNGFPSRTVYGDIDYPALRLITCGGSFDKAIGSYRSNVVVFAHLIGPVPA